MLNPGPLAPRGEVDFAIVGAGAAGIAAGRRLADAKVSFVILEARSRIGGRAWTATHAGYPLDLGCGWLHSGDRNPWTRIAEQAGFAIDRSPAPWSRDDRDLSFNEDEQREFEAASQSLQARLNHASRSEPDRPAAELLEPDCRWNPLLNAISSYANGAELDLVSARDASQYLDTGVNWRVIEGLGAAVASYGSSLPIVLDCAVRRIDHGGRQLRIETTRGDLTARAAIITLPTTLIANEAVRFAPALPEKLDAAAGLPLGLANKVTLAVEGAEELPRETRLFGRIDRAGTGAYHLRPFGRPLIEGYFGGRLARELEEAGEGALAQFAIDELVSQLGSKLRSRLRPVIATAWSADPYARGSYSYGSPGKAGAREILARPVDDRLFFAGEACSANGYSTAHGAYETGVAAAEQALSAIVPDLARID